MSTEEETADLLRRAEVERRALADAVGAVRDEVDSRRREFRLASVAAAALVGAGTMAYKLFGKTSPFARIRQAGSAASLILGLARAAGRWRRFF
jgi:hypothetical protein